MDDADIFSKLDEDERIFAPQQLPLDQQARIVADEGAANAALDIDEPPTPGIVGNIGTAPSGAMSVPNVGHMDTGGGPGDPETEARDPFVPDEPPFPR